VEKNQVNVICAGKHFHGVMGTIHRGSRKINRNNNGFHCISFGLRGAKIRFYPGKIKVTF
jgi:hypothetical protein